MKQILKEKPQFVRQLSDGRIVEIERIEEYEE